MEGERGGGSGGEVATIWVLAKEAKRRGVD